MKTSGPFLSADVNCLDFLLLHKCIVFCARLLHNFCSTMLSCNFTTLLQVRLEFFSSPSRTVSTYNFCVYEKSVVFFSSNFKDCISNCFHGAWRQYYNGQRALSKRVISGRCSGGQKVDCFIKTRRAQEPSKPFGWT